MVEARLHELTDSVPQLDEDRRNKQQAVNTESAKQRRACRRVMEALKALQEKVKTDGKLKPWLAKHGLDGLQGLWSRIHIEQGWENALEAALRERLGALEVSAGSTWCAVLPAHDGQGDTPPAKLASFYSPPISAAAPARLVSRTEPETAGRFSAPRTMPARLRCWATGCTVAYTAASLDEALAARQQAACG